MPIITVRKETNLWEEICAEFASKRAQGQLDAKSTSVSSSNRKQVQSKKRQPSAEAAAAEKQIYDPAKHTPVFCHTSYSYAPLDDPTQIQIDTRISHPACINYALAPVTDSSSQSSKAPSLHLSSAPIKPNVREYSTMDYLEKCVYPILLKGIEQLLLEAERRKCLERKRSAFNALDYLTRYLYYKRPDRALTAGEVQPTLSDQDEALEDIPFVHEHFKQYPRAPLPKSLVWTEDEAALIIQSFYRGYRIRKQAEVQELRQWQREWRESKRNIHDVVENFWREHSSPLPML